MPGVPTGTTILALRYADGVVVAGDRQATEGYQVAHRRIEKVFKTDDYSAVAIAGAAGPAIEMARLFQTELEHYEKVEGDGLSLEGKANKLGQMIRMNLPMAMQGLVVVPIFAGFDLRRGEGRIFNYDVTGGRYEETDYAATGSGGKDAARPLKKLLPAPGRPAPTRCRWAAEALVDAAEEDVGDGRPRLHPRDLPDREGRSPRDGFEDVAGGRGARPVRGRPGRAATGALIDAAALLRLARADDEGQGRVCPQGHRPRPVHRRRSSTQDGVLLVAENPSTLLHKICEIYDRIAFAGVGKYNEFENLRIAGVRHADLRGYSYHREDVHARRRSPTPTRRRSATIFTEELKPFEVEVLVVEVGDGTQRQERDVPCPLRRLDRGRAQLRGDGRPGGGDPPLPQGSLPGGARPSPTAVRRGHPRADGHAEQDADGPRPRGRRARPEASSAGSSGASPTASCATILGRPDPAGGRPAHGDLMKRRIFGLENEYGLTCTLNGQRRLSPDNVARYLFEKVIPGRSQRQRLPGERRPALPRHRLPSGVRDARVRRRHGPGRPRQGGRAHPRGPPAPRPSSGSARRASAGTSPVQEQHRLGGQLVRVPRELPRGAATARSSAWPRL